MLPLGNPTNLNTQPTAQTLPHSLPPKLELQKWPHYKTQKSIFAPNQQHLILFAYNKQKDENSPQQIMILEQPKKKYKQEYPPPYTLPHPNPTQVQEKLFLQKVDPLQRVQIAEEIKQMLSFSNQLSQQDRLHRRKEIFESSKTRKQHERAPEQVIAGRTIRLVKMDSLIQGGSIRGVVQLGSNPVQYEVLNLNEPQQEYYRLVKRVVRTDQIFPQLELEDHGLLYQEISYQPDQPLKEYSVNEDDYDSNDSDNPRFDYPDEDQSDRSSEGIIPRDYDSENEYAANGDEGMIEDEEEVYQRYLRRLKKREQQRKNEMDMEDEYQEF